MVEVDRTYGNMNISANELWNLIYIQDKSSEEVADIMGCTHATIWRATRYFGYPEQRKEYNLVDEKYGRLTVIKKGENRNGRKIYRCKCE